MRSSGTPCSFSTSTALIADPPVAANPYCQRTRLKSTLADSPSIGSSRSTYRCAISCGSYSVEERVSPRPPVWYAHCVIESVVPLSRTASPARSPRPVPHKCTHAGLSAFALGLTPSELARTRWMSILPILTLRQTSLRPASIACRVRRADETGAGIGAREY